MTAMACQVCGGDAWRTLYHAVDYFTGDGFDIVACAACGMTSTSPAPADMAKYYSRDYYGTQQHRSESWINNLLRQTRSLRARDVTAAADRWLGPGSRRVLDLGCGGGETLGFLKAQGWACAGAELSEMSAEAARTTVGCPIHTGPLAPDVFEPESFDVVTLWHSLEHFHEPRRTLDMAHRWLRPGGLLKVAVPDFGSWQARFGGPVGFHLDPPRHLHHFTRQTLARLLAETGFRPLGWSYFSLVYDLYSWTQTLLNRIGLPNALLYRWLHHRRGMSAADHALALLSGILAVPVGVVALGLTVLGAFCKNGSTMEVWAIRE